MIVRKLRLKRAWSQEQLATLTGLSVRTIQRIEQGQQPSLESKRALAAVFEVDLDVFNNVHNKHSNTQEANMTDNQTTSVPEETSIQNDEKLALQYAKSIKEFYTHLLLFLIMTPVIVITKGISEPIILFLAGGWTIGVIIHGLVAHEKISMFTPDWERKLAEKKLGRKL